MDVALASMNISQGNVQSTLNIGLMKQSMVNAEDQATELINDMLPATTAPSPYGFDTRA